MANNKKNIISKTKGFVTELTAENNPEFPVLEIEGNVNITGGNYLVDGVPVSGSGGGPVILNGDVSGSNSSTTILAIQGNPVDLTGISEGNVLALSGGIIVPISSSQSSLPSGFANVLYVDPTRGNDVTAEKGNSQLPFATVQGAVDSPSVVGGEEISIGPGTHTEQIQLNNSFTLVGQGIDTTRIDGFGGSNTIDAYDEITLRNITIQNTNNPAFLVSYTNNNVNIKEVYFIRDGSPGNAVEIYQASSVEEDGLKTNANIVYNDCNNVTIINALDNTDIQRNVLCYGVSTNVIIGSCTVNDLIIDGAAGGNLTLLPGSRAKRITAAGAPGFSFNMTDATIAGPVDLAYDNQLEANGCTIEGSLDVGYSTSGAFLNFTNGSIAGPVTVGGNVTLNLRGTKFNQNLLTVDPSSQVWRDDNLIAEVPPTASDDENFGWKVGSVWIDRIEGKSWTCVDASSGNAVWQLQGGSPSGFASIAYVDSLKGEDSTATVGNDQKPFLTGQAAVNALVSFTDKVIEFGPGLFAGSTSIASQPTHTVIGIGKESGTAETNLTVLDEPNMYPITTYETSIIVKDLKVKSLNTECFYFEGNGLADSYVIAENVSLNPEYGTSATINGYDKVKLKNIDSSGTINFSNCKDILVENVVEDQQNQPYVSSLGIYCDLTQTTEIALSGKFSNIDISGFNDGPNVVFSEDSLCDSLIFTASTFNNSTLRFKGVCTDTIEIFPDSTGGCVYDLTGMTCVNLVVYDAPFETAIDISDAKITGTLYGGANILFVAHGAKVDPNSITFFDNTTSIQGLVFDNFGDSGYVFVDPVYGNDEVGTPGKRNAPFKTISQALTKLEEDGVLWLNAGVYDESVDLAVAGNFAVTNFKIVGPREAIVHAQTVFGPTFYTSQQRGNITLQGFSVQNSTGYDAVLFEDAGASLITLDNIVPVQSNIQLNRTGPVLIKNIEQITGTIYLYNSGEVTFENCRLNTELNITFDGSDSFATDSYGCRLTKNTWVSTLSLLLESSIECDSTTTVDFFATYGYGEITRPPNFRFAGTVGYVAFNDATTVTAINMRDSRILWNNNYPFGNNYTVELTNAQYYLQLLQVLIGNTEYSDASAPRQLVANAGASYTIKDRDYMVVSDNTSNTTQIYLPPALFGKGPIVINCVADTSSYSVELVPFGTDTFEGAAGSFLLNTGGVQRVTIAPDPLTQNWSIIASYV